MSRFAENSGYRAYRLLQIIFVIAPIAAGLDKFFYLLTDWSNYLSPVALHAVSGHARGFMGFVGVVEIVAGLGVIFKPRIFSYIVAFWLFCIIINLVMVGHYWDVALRDVGLLLSALALGALSEKYA